MFVRTTQSGRPRRVITAVVLSAVMATGLGACGSQTVETAPAAAPAPPAPTGLSAQPVGADAVALSWTPVADPKALVRYEVRVDGGAPENVDSFAKTHTVTGLRGGPQHRIELLAVTDGGPAGAAVVDVTLPAGR